MGADVWTVDMDSKVREDFQKDREFLSPMERDMEDQRHIEIDLTSALVVRVIKEKSGGEFNLVTQANLDGSTGEQPIAMLLLKKGGMYDHHGRYFLKE
jgi:hypothetical protein